MSTTGGGGANPIVQPPSYAKKPDTKAVTPKVDLKDPNAYTAPRYTEEELKRRKAGARVARGRKKGGLNADIKAKLSKAEAFADAILSDNRYQTNLMHRAITGNLAPGLEALLWYYRFGRPVKRVEVKGMSGDDLSTYSNDELAQRAHEIAKTLMDLRRESLS